MSKRRVIVGISGATGFQYGVKALELLQKQDVEIHPVISRGAELTRALETEIPLDEVKKLAHVVHPNNSLGASISSGSFETLGMLATPCSMRNLSAIAHNFSDNLLTRAADVTQKERRRLVLVVREIPLNLGHTRNMTLVTEMGGIIFPLVPAMYQRPASLDEVITHSIGRALDPPDLHTEKLPHWGDNSNG